MASGDDDLKLVNRALARLGTSPIASLTEDTELAEKCNAVWNDVKETCLSVHTWSFGRKTYKLGRRVAAPGNGWTYGFDMPGGAIGGPETVLSAISPSFTLLREFDIQEAILFANCKDVWAKVRVIPEIAVWTPEFKLAVITGAAAGLAVPVAGDKNFAADLREQAFGRPEEKMTGGLLGTAIAIDRAKAPIASPLLRSDPLTAARHA